jgi:hypothetical protein
MEIFNYTVLVILPIFMLGFQALLLPVLFFLKSRAWLAHWAFAAGGAVIGIGFGYVFANVSGLGGSLAVAIAAVTLFGALSGWIWWYPLVKRLGSDTSS